MTNVQLKNELYYIGELAKIKQQLTEWDFRLHPDNNKFQL